VYLEVGDNVAGYEFIHDGRDELESSKACTTMPVLNRRGSKFSDTMVVHVGGEA
jgi:hypothetical protein